MTKGNNKTTYIQLFKGREDYFAQQGEDYYFPVHSALDSFYVHLHLSGDATFGVYVLNQENKCNFVCVDIDIPKDQLDDVVFTNRTAKYEHLSPFLQQLFRALEESFGIPMTNLLLEDTGGRGYHIWIFLAAPLAGDTAVAFGRALKSRVDFDFEFFPKQGNLGPSRKFGNLIKLPLGIHQKYGQRSVFFRLVDGKPRYIDDLVENLSILNSVLPVDPTLLERAGEGYQVELGFNYDKAFCDNFTETRRPMFLGSVDQLVANCTAMKMIREKASSAQKLSHSEAFHYTNVLLSVPGGERSAHDAMKDAFGSDYDERQTRYEIARIHPLCPTSCKALVDQQLCSDYCKQTVAERNRDPLVSNTSPCSVWLRRDRAKVITITADAVQAMANPETVERAFFRLKQYHEHEDSLFYDPFDFELFGAGLSANSQVVAKAFQERMDIPFAGYLPVSIPKKLDKDLKLQYRRMSYSTVYDQVPIQTAFDIIAPMIEETLQPCSYGYRWNLDDRDPSRIFENWREAYPRFSGDIMSAIQQYPIGYHICCDIKGYYDHVDHAILLEQLHAVVRDDYVRRFIEIIVRAHEAEPGSGKGLPQGPAYARLLANLYLNDFDRDAQEIAGSYFRYVDDFFLVFDSYQSAERGLERIIVALRKLGLELSDDEQKQAVVEPNGDLTNIRRTLDKIQYGILESTRQIQHLDPEAVSDFYSAVERHSGSPADLEQLIKINDALPSLLYVVSQEMLIPHHDFRAKLFAITRHLIKKGWFHPKRLKTIFYRLLEIEPDKCKFPDLFDTMEPAHRVFFLLSVFGCWRSRRENEDLLKVILAMAREDDDPFVWGFGIAISTEMGLNNSSGSGVAAALDRLSPPAGWFSLVRLLGSCDFVSLPAAQREVIRGLLDENSPDFIKAVMLDNLHSLPVTYLDGVYLRRLLGEFCFLLIPAITKLLAVAKDKSEGFDAIVDFILSKPSFKSICVSLVTQALREEHASAGWADIMNLQALYASVSDTELQNAMLEVLSSIHTYSLSPDENFAKTHTRVDTYNGCYLFQRIEGKGNYQYLEFIPEDRLRESLKCDFDSTKGVLADLASKGVLAPHEFSYDSRKREVTLHLDPRQEMIKLNRGAFLLEPTTIAEALRLAANAFKKAVYFSRITGKVPLVNLQNLLLDRNSGTVTFHTVGRSMQTPHIISGVTIGEEIADIARMIALLLQDFFFTTDTTVVEFLKKKHHPPASAFLAHIIKNLSSREPSHRYSCSRFQHLTTAFSRCQAGSNEEVAVLYLFERLKAGLFRNNFERISWHGACSALNGHITDVRLLFDKECLSKVPLRNITLGYAFTKGQLHSLSLQMLNLSMNRIRIPSLRSTDPSYLDLVEYLLLYAVLCVEVVSLCRTVWRSGILDTAKYHLLLMNDEVVVETSGYKQPMPSSDLAELFTYRTDKTGTDIKDLSLRQIALFALLAFGGEVRGNHIDIAKPDGLPRDRFDDLAHACLFRIPRVEVEAHTCLGGVISALRTGDDIATTANLDSIRKAVDVIARDFTRLRRSMKLKRYRGWINGKKWPEKVVCKSRFRSPATAEEDAIPAMGLVNVIPSGRYQGSWDMSGGGITNLIIPSLSVYSFLTELKKGKVFGRKLTYLYSGCTMLPWDVALFVVSLLVLILLKYGENGFQNSLLKNACAVGSDLVLGIVSIFAGKLLYDLRHWFPKIDAIIAYIRNVSAQGRNRKKENDGT